MVTGMLLAFPVGVFAAVALADKLPPWLIFLTAGLLGGGLSMLLQHLGAP